MSLCLKRVLLVVLPTVASAGGILDRILGAFNFVGNTGGVKDVEVRVERQTWTWKMEIEVLIERSEAGWCSEKPEDAYDLVVTRKQRTQRFETRMVNGRSHTYAQLKEKYNGPEMRLTDDGIARSHEDFFQYYGEESVADKKWIEAGVFDHKSSVADAKWRVASATPCSAAYYPYCLEVVTLDFWCEYTLDRWVKKGEATVTEDNAYPYRPQIVLYECRSPAAGCERKGKTTQSFSVDLAMTESEKSGAESKTLCNEEHIDFSQWQLLEVGWTYPAKRSLAHGLFCSSIRISNDGCVRRFANDGKAYTYDEFVDLYGQAAQQKWPEATCEDELPEATCEDEL